MLKIDMTWQGEQPDRLIKKTAVKAARAAARYEGRSGSVSMLMTDDETIQSLNKQYRGIDKSTDVLSFPSGEDRFLGDIAISMPHAREQAKEYGHPLEREVAFLAVHAMLHLFGFDHMEEAGETAMRARQREILKKAGYDIQ